MRPSHSDEQAAKCYMYVGYSAQGNATIAIIAEDVFLNIAQIRNGTHEPLFSLKEHPLNIAGLRTTTFDTCEPSTAKGTTRSKSFVEGIEFPMEHTNPQNNLHQATENTRVAYY